LLVLDLLVKKFRSLELVYMMDRHSDTDWNVSNFDGRALLVFSFFVSVVVHTILGSYLYDPTGIYNPTWTGIFG
jgi:hypothetical protein